ncbi:hypothetical protein IBB56_05805 [Listeria welshimeri]|uniref:hypothetical protein n=1 Tax=Listeria welshimeri TaxID=1643 RepID=UPI001623A588|nr:hypothetical protein [Listeria welshimeri]MBC1981532.1 hypothetical protein [Listeria welshimeri]MBC2007139.1 hypothetical protein [Listeria welshimeri]MBC2008432.1 hypothetical protein [Listeria welshimeri]MBC2042808.1 hypothetical protein [Listeria welshimeri]MBC2065363.1 hypothetical protein [Listeria welshimeri]
MNTIKDLKNFYEEIGIELCPYKKETIETAIQKCGTLPDILIQYYETIGSLIDENEDALEDFPFDIMAPFELHEIYRGRGQDEYEEYIKIAEEIHGSIEFVVKKSELSLADPDIYICGDTFIDEMKKQDRLYVSAKSVGETQIKTLWLLLIAIAKDVQTHIN